MQFSKSLGLTFFKPVLYVLVGATVGLGLLATAFGSDPSVVMGQFVVDAAVEIWPLVQLLLIIWAVLTALAALIAADIGAICGLSDAGRKRLAHALLGQTHLWIVPVRTENSFVRHSAAVRSHTPLREWTAGVNPPLVFE